MLVIGTKGFAVQLTDVLLQLNEEKFCYFDDVNNALPARFLDKYPIITRLDQAADYLLHEDNRFVLGLGNPANRKSVSDMFLKQGGKLSAVISPLAIIGKVNVIIGEGVNILSACVIESTVKIGYGSLLNIGSIVTHGTSIGEFCEIAPRVTICGDCKIGNNVFIGTGAVIIPKIVIGDDAVIGAGSLIMNDVAAKMKVKGVYKK